jgi:hypothetical protein
MKLDEAFERVWRAALVEKAAEVELGEKSYRVRKTPRSGLRQVDFEFEGRTLRGLEQNPKTASRWAKLAKAGHKVMQFLETGRYVGNVVDGKVMLYGHGTKRDDRAKSQGA